MGERDRGLGREHAERHRLDQIAPFVVAQLLVLAGFVVLTVTAVRRFRGAVVARA